MTDLGSKKPLKLAHFGYKDVKIFGTIVWDGSLDINIDSFMKIFKIMTE